MKVKFFAGVLCLFMVSCSGKWIDIDKLKALLLEKAPSEEEVLNAVAEKKGIAPPVRSYNEKEIFSGLKIRKGALTNEDPVDFHISLVEVYVDVSVSPYTGYLKYAFIYSDPSHPLIQGYVRFDYVWREDAGGSAQGKNFWDMVGFDVIDAEVAGYITGRIINAITGEPALI